MNGIGMCKGGSKETPILTYEDKNSIATIMYYQSSLSAIYTYDNVIKFVYKISILSYLSNHLLQLKFYVHKTNFKGSITTGEG